ncbi:transposase [Bradyrhizobium ontarionense]|uniref:transposase n=1 Tax=Bradyrhizobium ontarionense TaxID=2898149 RepID=UPI0021123AFF|nr:transposase [Bradyrhizobium sp. A19]
MQLLRDIAAAIDHRETEIERLKSIIKQLQRMQFDRSSERIDPDQFVLGLEDLRTQNEHKQRVCAVRRLRRWIR